MAKIYSYSKTSVYTFLNNTFSRIELDLYKVKQVI